MRLNWAQLKSEALELKKNFAREILINRYQKLSSGELTFEEKVAAAAVSSRNHFIASWRAVFKRVIDISLSLIVLVLALPLMSVVAIAVRLDSPGPVLYKQTRVGMKGKLFNIMKFRTMRSDAEAGTGPVWAKENDPRVTPLGLFLRTSHLDELPQLFNVLTGEMSLVGPRPERPYFVNEFRRIIPHYEERLNAKPGITGLAQVKRRYDETLADVKKKVRYDLLYIKKMCPLLDIQVLALTALTIILRTGR